jgi:putative transposase
MSFTKLVVHAVWGTHNRSPILVPELRQKVIKLIEQNAKDKGIKILCINGHLDHLHCLFYLNVDLSVAKTVQLLKGESSYWVNKNHLTDSKFEWAEEFYAASVGSSDFVTVKKYIENQEEHHRKKTFDQEYCELILPVL